MKIPVLRLDLDPDIIQYEYFVIEDQNFILLMTFFWYEPQNCDIAVLKEVNRFEKSTQSWQHGNFIIEKFNNLNGCKINFLIEGGMPEFHDTEIDTIAETITECVGYVCALVRDASKSLNYTYHMDGKFQGSKIWPHKPCHVLLQYGITTVILETLKKNPSSYTRPMRTIEFYTYSDSTRI